LLTPAKRAKPFGKRDWPDAAAPKKVKTMRARVIDKPEMTRVASA
jgi:hypothetical protein